MLTTTRKYLSGLASALTSKTGITLQEGQGWSANMKTKVLTYNPSDLLLENPIIAKGLLLHEIGHLRYSTGIHGIEKTTPYAEHLHGLTNALEDLRIEFLMSCHYGEFADIPIRALDINCVHEKPVTPVEKNADAELAVFEVLCLTMLRQTCSAVGLRKFQDKCGKMGREFYQSHYSELGAIADKCTSDVLRDTQAVLDLVQSRLIPILKPLLDLIPPKEGSGEGSGESSKTSTEKTSTMGTRQPAEGHKLSDYHNDKLTARSMPSDEELENLLAPFYQTLAQRLHEVLEERKASKFSGQHRSGKLLGRNAYKVLTDEARIFSRKTEPDKADFKAIICLDNSGSMSNDDRHPNAYMTAFLLKRTFETMGAPFDFIIYDDDARLLHDLSEYRPSPTGNNVDAEALDLACEHLDPNRDNLVLMLSDGSICTDIEPPMQRLRKLGAHVVGIGVGINTSELKNAYGEAINCPDVTDLPKAVISLLRQLIARG